MKYPLQTDNFNLWDRIKPKYSWPLAKNNFNLIDRLKVCLFYLNFNNRWTQDKYVMEFENIAANYVGAKYAVFVCSGSAANDLIAKQIKDSLTLKKEWPKRNKVIVNAVSWATNVSVFIREGYDPIFIDINLSDYCLDYNKLEQFLEKNHETVTCVFPTSVLGHVPNINKLKSICSKYNVKLALDNCELSEGKYDDKNICGTGITCSTSGFLAHQWNSGQESGLIFTDNKEEYEYFLLSRAHGLRRNLIPYLEKLDKNVLEKYTNSLVDPQFDFQTVATNFRNTEIAAFLSILDSKKWIKHRQKRIDIYNIFVKNIDKSIFHIADENINAENVPFCIPIVLKNKDLNKINKIKEILDSLKIERRSFISGSMLRQKVYSKYADYKDFPIAEHINNFALYIGLNYDLEEKHIIELCEKLNSL